MRSSAGNLAAGRTRHEESESMDAPPEQSRSARHGKCQFAPQAKAQSSHGGALFCLLHLPFEAERKRVEDFMVLLNQALSARVSDLSEVQFPSTSTVNPEHANDMIPERCVFGEISLNLRNARIASCEVKDPISVIARGIRTRKVSGTCLFGIGLGAAGCDPPMLHCPLKE